LVDREGKLMMHRFPAMGIPYSRLAVLAAGVALATAGVLVSFNSAGVATAQGGAARGKQVYTQNCQICHGVNAQGRIGPPLNEIPPEISQAPRPAVVQQLTGLIRGGIPGAMPGFVPGQISDADIAALVDYLLDETAKPLPGRSYYEALQPVPAVANTDTLVFFPQTGHTVTGGFKAFWEANGGLAIFGYPITEEYAGFTEDGAPATMQDFERARFEYRDGRVELAALGNQALYLRTTLLGRGGPPEGGPGAPEKPGGPGMPPPAPPKP
jgi:mono/diheme cytochrome c family protein